MSDAIRAEGLGKRFKLMGRVVADLGKQLWSLPLTLGLVLGLVRLVGFDGDGGVPGVLGAAGLLPAFAVAMSWMTLLIGIRSPGRRR